MSGDLARVNLHALADSTRVSAEYSKYVTALDDDGLDSEIAQREQLAVADVTAAALHVAQWTVARAERGRRTANLRGKSVQNELPRSNSLSPVERKVRSEERVVGDNLTNAQVRKAASDGGWKNTVRVARATKKDKAAKVAPPKTKSAVKHPAKFSDPIIVSIAESLPDSGTVLDPFAGVGRIHELATDTLVTIGVEIEPEWADTHVDTICGNALDLAASGIMPDTIDVIATSPTYGNRLADSHDAKDASDRRSYTHDLGRTLHPDNSGDLQWGDEYREFHRAAYAEAVVVLRPGGLFICNVSDHIRAGEPQGVHIWHAVALTELGLVWVDAVPIETRRMRRGANAEARVAEEWKLVLRKRTA